MMKTQFDLIGNHPTDPQMFGKWLECEDKPVTASQRHRSLTEKLKSNDPDLVDWLARKLFHHHHSEYRIKRLQAKYEELNYPAYAAQHRKLPTADRTKKGNAAEVILTEYLEGCFGKTVVKAFKLKYNANADQALKGDDTLLVDVEEANGTNAAKIYLGEAKYRAIPTKKVVGDISSSLSKDKLPLSFSFLIDELARDPKTRPLADLLDDLMLEEIKKKGNLIYTGLLLSNPKTGSVVDANLDNVNPEFVLISIGIENPEDLITLAFQRAQYYVLNPDKL